MVPEAGPPQPHKPGNKHDPSTLRNDFLHSNRTLGLGQFALLGSVVAIPYLRCKVVPATGLPNTAPRPYLAALSLHYWLAPAVFAISFLHAWIPMASGHMPHTSMRGL